MELGLPERLHTPPRILVASGGRTRQHGVVTSVEHEKQSEPAEVRQNIRTRLAYGGSVDGGAPSLSHAVARPVNLLDLDQASHQSLLRKASSELPNID